MREDQDIQFMSRQDLKAEVLKLRQAIRQVVTQRADSLCWRDVYTDLAKLVSIEFCPELIVDSDKFARNCQRFDESLRTGGPYKPVYVEKKEDS